VQEDGISKPHVVALLNVNAVEAALAHSVAVQVESVHCWASHPEKGVQPNADVVADRQVLHAAVADK